MRFFSFHGLSNYRFGPDYREDDADKKEAMQALGG